MPITVSDPTSLRQDRQLARSRLGFLSGDQQAAAGVRAPIVASWRRSQEHHIPVEGAVPPTVDEWSDTPLARAAAPVLRNLYTALAGQPICIVLTDQRGLVLRRLTDDVALQRRLDRVELTPGFVYAEEFVGTNGIGTALESGSPTFVFGHEHYAERLEDLACAGVPLRHPITGRTMGILDLTCWRRDAGSLLLTLATSTANQIQDAVRDQTDFSDRLILNEYLRACHRSGGIVLAVGREIGMLNQHARSVLDPADQAALLGRAADLLAQRSHSSQDVDLPGGSTVRMTCHPVNDEDRLVGLVIRVGPRDRRTRRGQRRTRTASEPLPGLVGRAPVWTHACRETERLFLLGEWLAVVGEQGVGKLSLLRAVQLRQRPVPRLSVFDAVDATQSEWLEDLRRALNGGADSIVIAHVDRLDEAQLRSVRELLQELRQPGREEPLPWVGVTLAQSHHDDEVAELLGLFPATVTVPPLRQHPEDIALLVAQFLSRLSEGRPLRCSAEAMAMLTRSAWPGNSVQLHRVLRSVREHRRSGIIRPEDLPPETHSVSRRMMSQIESLERDAIVNALIEADGDRTAAARSLGMSRATMYRRIRAYGIVE